MTSTRYRAGRDLEYAARADLEVNGYIAFRTAGSHGAADVIAIKRGEILLVQCKTGGVIGPAERMELYGIAQLVGAVPLCARWHKEGRAARMVWFLELLGSEKGQQRPWTPDHGLEVMPGQMAVPFPQMLS